VNILNETELHRLRSFRAAYDLSYINDIFGNLAQEINANIGSGSLDGLKVLYDSFLLYQLELSQYYSYFLSTLNFNNEEQLISAAIEENVSHIYLQKLHI